MPKLIPVQTVIVHRDGKSAAAPLGEVFDFTDDEAEHLLKNAPDSVREPVNEVPVEKAPAKAPAKTGKSEDL